ncbi:hypothetical protein SDC9_173476 [bioreactor metagenome]|uniref:Uncharacterized protein n=1 Tax=bioreactor metagenome TaxID=1076179 RepID=A0A645GQ17_9ZZZZ
MALDLAFRQGAHLVHEGVPLADGNAQLAFDGLGIKAGGVGDLHGVACPLQGNRQGVVADHPHGSGHSDCGQGAITGSRQEQITVDNVIALKGR